MRSTNIKSHNKFSIGIYYSLEETRHKFLPVARGGCILNFRLARRRVYGIVARWGTSTPRRVGDNDEKRRHKYAEDSRRRRGRADGGRDPRPAGNRREYNGTRSAVTPHADVSRRRRRHHRRRRRRR